MEINHLLAPSEEYNITPICDRLLIQPTVKNDDGEIRPCEDNNDDFKEQIANMSGMAIIMLEEFMQDCRKMAQENWCPSQVEMLDRLFKAVSLDEKYDEV